ncbi:hypothetical protein H4Q26_007288 [Puccinia striiformis f. sp. tritici PST-130]|nr:hypothetical protein H4Q26_007288 [Puccinia striiformis f. sp. tritici PST-130]
MLTYLTSLASYYLLPQQSAKPRPAASNSSQILLSQHPSFNQNALSLATIASETDHQTQTAQSFLAPSFQAHEQHTRVIPSKTTTIKLNLHQFISSTPTVPPPPITTTSSPYKALSPRATQDLISRLDATSPLLPQNLAQFITAASLAARVSLRSSAFFIELIIESLRYSTTTSLGIIRRALISAVGSARAIHHNSSTSNQPNQVSIHCNNNSNSNYLNVLDHYTNVGIYLVHHVFTMAELLSIAGLDLTHSVISTGFETAEISVMMLDSIFGSNESSRALSAIIMLVRRELLHDPRFTPSHSSTLTGLVALTKAITAFACLQLATSRRTTASMKMRVVWDATMIAESVTESKSLVDGIDYQLGIKQGRAHGCNSPHDLSQEKKISDPAVSHPTSGRPSPRQSIHKLSESDKSSLVTDLRSTMAGRATRVNYSRMNSSNSSTVSTSIPQAPAHRLEEREEIEYKLTQILNDGEINVEPYPSYSATGLSGPSDAEKLVSDDLRQALYQVKRTTYSRTQSYSSELASLATATLPDHSSTSTYQLTTLTTQTMRTRTTTTSTTHSSTQNDHLTSDHDHYPVNTSTINGILSPKPSYEAHQVHWSADFNPVSGALNSAATPSHKKRLTTKHSKSHFQLKDLANDRMDYEAGEQPPLDYFSPRSSRSKAKSMPSSPQRSFFLSKPKVATRSIIRSQTHSDVHKLMFLDDPYSFVYPVSTMAPSQTPLSSPSVLSEESSLESDGPLVIQPDDPDYRSVSLPSMVADLRQEDDDRNASGYFDVIPERPRKTVTQPPLFTTPQQSSSSIQTIRTHRVSQILSPTVQPPTSDFPPQSLVKNLGRFMRYSSAAYGQQFLRIMGIGVDSFNYPNTKKHSANDHAFASHVGLTVDQILLSSFTEPNPVLGNEVLSPLVHYVSIDHDSKAIVLTCRGTLGLSDILVDLTCEYEPIAVDGGDPNASYLAHSGMLHSALRLRRESSTVHEVIKQALIDYSNYGLIITGHSLGGGVAALLAVLCSTRTETFLEQIDRQPSPIAHPPISTNEYTKGLVTTVCNGIDIVPTLSLGVLHDLKSIAISLHEEESVAIDIVKRVVGLYRPTKWMNSNGSASNPTSIPQQQQAQELLDQQEVERSKQKVTMNDHEIRNGVGMNRATGSDYLDPALDGSVFGKAENTPELADWLWSLRRTMRAVSDAEKLYPPGEVWHVESYEVFVVRENESSSSTSTTSTSGSSKDSRHSASTSDTRPVPVRPPPRTFSSSSSWKSSSQQQQQQSTHSQQATSSRREGRRIILRACDDVQARFSEPIFGKTMFHDHIPSQYELVLELLEAAIGSTNSPLHPMSSSSTNTSPSSGTK